MPSFYSGGNQQKSLTSFYRRQMSTNDVPRFEQLFVRMTVSNGLPFSFAENDRKKLEHYLNLLHPVLFFLIVKQLVVES